MQRENMSRSTFVKGIAATCIAACSLGALSSGEYSTKSGDTYTASAAGIESDVSVTVTVDKSGTIKDVSVDVSGETPGVGADIGDEITQQILDAQSADIDGIAGATITSNAVKTALADALSQAGIDSGLESTTPAQGNAAETAGAESTTEAAESTTEAAAAEGTAETAAAAAGSYTPGTYTASAKGMDGDVPVTITIGDDGTITGVQVDVSGETAGIGAEIGDEVTKQILDAQSAEIDGVAGATVTSTAVKTAVADALAQASGAAAESATEAAATSQTEAAAAESATEAAATEGTAETAAAAAGSYTPGTYTASAKGMDGDVPVTITIGDDGTITGVQVDVSGETAGIGAEIGDEVTKQILDAQSAEIDGVAGATVTSTAVKTAVADALAQASGAAAKSAIEAAATESATEAAATSQTETAAAESATEAAAASQTEAAAAESATEAAAASQTEAAAAESATEAAAAESTTKSAAETETAATKPAAETEAQTETAPIYSYGKFTGTSGDASVTVTVKDGKLVSIEGLPEDTSKVTADVKAAARAALEKAGMDTVLFIPGTYTASAKGMDSDVTVTVTVDENKITDADIDVSGETQGIGATIGDTVRLQILSAQSDDIEGVSGATVSSAAVKKALADALDQASIAADDVPSNAENVTEAATE